MASYPSLDLAYAAASEHLAALKAGRLRSRELLEMYLDRIADINKHINAVVTIAAQDARRHADAADEARERGEWWGPLHGLPVTIKDELEVEGMRSTYGVTDYATHIGSYDAASVAGVRAAGAIIFGKSNLPAYAADLQSHNLVFGVTNNPWDLERTPGGSSGGSAAALAAGLTSLDIGTDMGGSIRIPASWCGVYGHKPTQGLVSQFGDVGETPRYAQIDLFTHGPMGRAAADLRVGLEAISSQDASGARKARPAIPEPTISGLRGMRVAAWLDDASCPVSSEVLSVLSTTVDAMRKAGCIVNEQPELPMPTKEMILLWERLFGAAAWAGMDEELEAVQELAAREGDRFPIAQVVLDAARMSHAEWLRLNEQRAQLCFRWTSFFQVHDVLICPAVATVAPRHYPPGLLQARTIEINGQERPFWDLFTWAGLTTLADLPSTVAPVGLTVAGLPVGLQIVCEPWADLNCIEFARFLESIAAFQPPPRLVGEGAE